MKKLDRPRDFVGQIIAYEMGEMTPAEVRECFQYLIDRGLVWKMADSYGRMARIFIERGECRFNEEAPLQAHPPTDAVETQTSERTKLRIIAAIVLTVLMFLAGKLAE